MRVLIQYTHACVHILNTYSQTQEGERERFVIFVSQTDNCIYNKRQNNAMQYIKSASQHGKMNSMKSNYKLVSLYKENNENALCYTQLQNVQSLSVKMKITGEFCTSLLKREFLCSCLWQLSSVQLYCVQSKDS